MNWQGEGASRVARNSSDNGHPWPFQIPKETTEFFRLLEKLFGIIGTIKVAQVATGKE